MEQTPNYNLRKPAPEDFYDVADQNANMDAIDAALKAQEDELARKAGLDEHGKVPAEQLPEISSLGLGETADTAYRGDRGKLAYEHTMDGTKHITGAEREKLAGIAAGANKTVVDAALSSDSENPVQNKVVQAALEEKAEKSEVEAGLATGLAGKVDLQDFTRHSTNQSLHVQEVEKMLWNNKYGPDNTRLIFGAVSHDATDKSCPSITAVLNTPIGGYSELEGKLIILESTSDIYCNYLAGITQIRINSLEDIELVYLGPFGNKLLLRNVASAGNQVCYAGNYMIIQVSDLHSNGKYYAALQNPAPDPLSTISISIPASAWTSNGGYGYKAVVEKHRRAINTSRTFLLHPECNDAGEDRRKRCFEAFSMISDMQFLSAGTDATKLRVVFYAYYEKPMIDFIVGASSVR